MRRFGAIVFAAAVTTLVGFSDPAIASAADTCMHGFGSDQKLVDATGATVQEWNVRDLKKSPAPTPGYPLAGQLWEATVSVEAVSGTVTPLIPNIHALTAQGASYPALWQLSTSEGIPGATLAQGQASTGKVYFDATGSDPVAVTYTAGGTGTLMWCCDGAMMAMPMDNCPCCTPGQPCPCCDMRM